MPCTGNIITLHYTLQLKVSMHDQETANHPVAAHTRSQAHASQEDVARRQEEKRSKAATAATVSTVPSQLHMEQAFRLRSMTLC